MKKLGIYLLFLTIASSGFAEGPIWHAHPNKQESEEMMLKKNLDFILTVATEALGLQFVSLEPEYQYQVYQNAYVIPEYTKRIGMGNFRTFEAFYNKMLNYSHQKPNTKTIYVNTSNEAYISTAFAFKKLKQEMAIDNPTMTYQDSFEGLQISDYRTENSQGLKNMALKMASKVCKGDVSGLGMWFESLNPKLIEIGSNVLTGKSCINVVKKDILEIVDPYDCPLGKDDQSEGQLEGTSIYLAKKLIPNRDYENSDLFRALLRSAKIPVLLTDRNLFQAFRYHLNMFSNIDIVRLINLANHNHGLEFFVINAILDLSDDVEQVKRNVKAAYSAINHLYKLIGDYDKTTKAIALKKQEQRAKTMPVPKFQYQYHHLQYPGSVGPAPKSNYIDPLVYDRQYHYWGGTFVACELMERDYNEILASFVSARLGQAYEMSTRNGNKENIEESNNDILLHRLGAAIAGNICD